MAEHRMEALDYAERPRRRRGRAALAAVAVALSVAAAVAALACAGRARRQWWPAASARLRMEYAWYQCMNWVEPPSHAVRINGGHPACWDVVRPHERIYDDLFEYQMLFLHGRTSPRGERRLVAVLGYAAPNGRPDLPPGTHAWSIDIYAAEALVKEPLPPTPGHPCPWYADGQKLSGPSLALHDSEREAKVYAGQPDPSDESHFTIAYELDGERGTIDGWLTDDPKEVIRFKVRDGPALHDNGDGILR